MNKTKKAVRRRGEQLNNSYFVNSEEILRKFYYNGLISDELLPDELGYLKFISLNDYDKNYTFPEEPVLDRNRLISHVRKSYNDKRKIVSVKVERTVKKGQNPDGSTFELINEDTRKGAMRIYTPEGTKNYCFCQICQQINSNELIEVIDFKTTSFKPASLIGRFSSLIRRTFKGTKNE